MSRVQIYRDLRRKHLAEVAYWRAEARREGHKWQRGDWQYFTEIRMRLVGVRRQFFPKEAA